jgi:pimeloyl-ACP methyl ester carboxylesterase
MNELGEPKEVRTPEWRLRYWERGEGEPIVFLHGIGVNALLWRNVVPELAGSYRCICPELPLGAHEVPMPRDADLTPPGIAALVDGFLKELDLTGVTLVGNDTGGAIAQLVATNHPERLARLVLTPSDAFDHFLPPGFRYLQAAAFVPGAAWLTVQSMRIERVRRMPIAYGKLTRRPVPREITDAWVAPGRHAAIRRDLSKVLRGIRKRYTIEAAQKLRSFDKPTLIAWPRKDPVFRFEHAERLAKLIPNAKLVEIEDSYGFVSEDQPKQLASEIAAFLKHP